MLKKECKLGNAMNANKVFPWMLMRKCLLAMLILMLAILMLILMLLNLNTGYADTDADLCIRIMSLCCIEISSSLSMFANKDNDIQTDIHNDIVEFYFYVFTHACRRCAYHMNMHLDIDFWSCLKNNKSS